MKKIFLALALALAVSASSSFAGLPEMMKIYNNPSLAPKVKGCSGNVYCNGFIALSKKWNEIPESYRYKGEWNIKSYAKDGVTYDDQGRNIGLQRGFYFYTETSNNLIEGVDKLGTISGINYEGGLAVLLYIEDKNGWAKD